MGERMKNEHEYAEIDRLKAAQNAANNAEAADTNDGGLPLLPEWSKRDDLGGLVPSEVRQAMRAYALAALATAKPTGSEQDAMLLAKAMDALQKLVEAKDMKERLKQLHESGHGTDYGDYYRLRNEGWAAARAAIATKEKAP
jgi:hypothetical protein